ncbi:MAG TPA: hypothetical protein ENH35_05930 [Candidatus Moranbacteria bacterium]|nr:hypothetical protein [Candidatus Moranbacteria bacterium]HDZ86050.1 hypothetical protein [Candidatus Moranbacteria bacterium]
MPLVLVKKDKKKLSDRSIHLNNLIQVLPVFVADALTVPNTDGELTPGDIEVYVSDFGPLDVHTKLIEIIVFSNEYPERIKNLDERRDKLIRSIKGYSPIKDGFVWIFLGKGSFNTF